MPWMMPVAVGGASLIGNMMAQQGQQQTNQMSTENMLQSEHWQEYMSDTQMQRRVQDLKAAGLNPMLAATSGQGAAMGSPVMPSLQNPSAAFGNLGGQVAGAAQLAQQNAQIDALKAQAARDQAQASTTGAQQSAIVDNIKSQTGLNDVRATEVSKNVQMLNIQLQPFGKDGVSRYEESYSNTVAQNAIKTHIAQMDEQTQSDTLLSLIRARNDENYASQIAAKNIYNASSTEFGRIMSYFHLAAPLTSAVGVAGKLIP